MTLMPADTFAQRIQQQLNRGVVAVVRDVSRSTTAGKNGNLISWRKLAQEPENTVYNVYQNGTKIASTTKTNHVPANLSDGDVLKVVPVYGGTEDESMGGSFTFDNSKTLYPNAFVNIDFETTICPATDYRTKYVWPADLNGDGELEWVVSRLTTDWDKGNHKLQAYMADGTCLWTVDIGPNIALLGGHSDNVTVYDINCDGKAEVIIRSSDGTRFWNPEANTWGAYVNGSATADTDGDGIVDYTKQTKRNPPFYLTVIEGMTGKEICSAELDYTKVSDGTDQYSRDNRADYMNDDNGREYAHLSGHMAVTYGDGVHPMIMMECQDRTVSGQNHHNYVFGFSFDWNGNQPSNWHHSFTWSRNDKTPWPSEFHQLRVADVDGDGIDEMLQGGFGVNAKKGMVFSAGIGHGDRYRVGDLDPDRPGMEVFAIQQSDLLGQLVYDAETGKHLKEWYLPNVFDVGRGECMDVDSTRRGYEIYSLLPNLYDIKGNVIKAGATTYPYEGIWWNGDLLRETLASPGGKYYSTNSMVMTYGGGRLAEFSAESDWATHAVEAARAGFWGDIVGDWREEVVLLKQNDSQCTGLVGYTTNLPTEYSMYTLQEDPHYRLDCTTRGYYQSPNVSFYLGHGMPYPPLPGVIKTDLRWSAGSAWDAAAASFKSFDLGASLPFADGKSVLFDISGDNAAPITLSATVAPKATYFMVPRGHTYTISGGGNIGGSGEIWKSERGTVNIDANFTTTGKTVVSNGILQMNGTIAGDLSLRALGTLAGNVTVNGNVDFEGALHYEGCRLMPGSAADYGCITFGKSLNINKPVYIEANIGGGKADKIVVKGNLAVTDTLTFTLIASTDSNAELKGDYTLAEAEGELTADVAMLKVRGLEGQPYRLKAEGGKIVLSIPETRAAATGVVWTGSENANWDYLSENFRNGSAASAFVQHDAVVFDDGAAAKNIVLNSMMIQSGVEFNNNQMYTLSGSGGISGTGALVKEGAGELALNMKNSDYTGATIVRGGTLTVTELKDASEPSSIGAASADAANLQISNAMLKIDADNIATNRGMTIAGDATVNVANKNGSVALKGIITGSDGTLIKDGEGQLNINYPGLNPIKALVMKAGTLAQGTKKATLGDIPVSVVGKGTRINLIANENFDNMPNYRHATDIAEEADLTIGGTYRGYLNGSFTGKGTLTLNTGYVRYDVGSDFSQFEGTVILNGATRLMPELTDMSKLTLTLADGTSLRHYKSGGGTTVAAALKVGAVAYTKAESTGTTATFGASDESWEVGYNDKDAVFGGFLNLKKVTKVGIGLWTITSTYNATDKTGSTADVDVAGGGLVIRNFTNRMTSGIVTVKDSGTVYGFGETNSIIAQAGGTVTGGLNDGSVGTLKTTSNMIFYSGSTLLVKVSTSSNDKFNVKGTLLRLADGAIIRIQPLAGKTFAAGEKLVVFTGRMPSGSWTIDGGGYDWDDTYLATEGYLLCKGAASSVRGVEAGNGQLVDVYTLDGQLVHAKVVYEEALRSLPRGIYLINGRKVIKQ